MYCYYEVRSSIVKYPAQAHLLQSYGRTDKLWLKGYVFVAWVFDTLHQMFLLSAIYTFLVKDIGNLPALATFPV